MVQYAENSSSIVQYELGQMFQSNNKVRNYKQAVKWYKLSAKHGYRRAQHLLGAMYAQGRGVARNHIKAYAWCKVSAWQHSRRALLKLKIIEDNMSADQISYARKLSRQYYEIYVAPFALGRQLIKSAMFNTDDTTTNNEFWVEDDSLSLLTGEQRAKYYFDVKKSLQNAQRKKRWPIIRYIKIFFR